MPKVHFIREDRRVDVPAGADLRRWCKDNGVQIYPWHARIGNCFGHGLCGTCLVQVDDPAALSPRTAKEVVKLGLGFPAGYRLACQATVVGDMRCLTQPTPPEGWHVHPAYRHLALPDPFAGLSPLGQEAPPAAQAEAAAEPAASQGA